MALQFPTSASIGQTYQSGSSPIYTYNGNVWALSSGNNGIAQLNAYTASLKTAIQTTGSAATILGNLNVQGTQTSLNQASLQITDKFIRVASGSLSSAQSDGAGIRIDGANVTMSWDSANTQLAFNTQISASRFVGDGSGLTGVTSYTNSDNLAYLNSKGVISGSSQVVGILSSLNTYTGSNDTKWSAVQSVTSSLISATSSYETKGRGIVSGSSQLTSSYDVRYEIVGRNIISGSSQLTSSFDGRYIQTGSYNLYTASINSYTSSNDTTNTTQNNRLTALENKTGSLATTGSNTFIGAETISGSILLSGSFSYNGTSLQNGFAFAQPTLRKILDNVSYTGATAWSASYTASGGAVIVRADYTAYKSTTGTGTAVLYRDGVSVATSSFYFNVANNHTSLPTLTYATNAETGAHTYSIGVTNMSLDTNDYATIHVLEYGNSAMFPTTIISGSSQLTASYDARYLTIGGDNVFSSSAQLPGGLVSGSSQLTSSYDTRYTLSGSVGATPAGTISGSSQLTASFDTRYALSGSGGSATIPTGTVSGSSQLTASYDGRYTLTSSFNAFTASAQAVTTGANSFNGTQTITGSLIITTGSFFASQLVANTASLYLTSGSNLYVQNNGLVEITGSIIATSITGSIAATNGVISGSSQLTASYDTRYTLSGSISSVPAGTVSGSSQLTSSYDLRYEGVGRGIVSGSTQLTASFETIGRGIISSSAQLPNGLISGSSQLTASFDVRYAPSASYITSINGAISSSTQVTNGSGIISGSSQLTASYDTRYTLSGSVQNTTLPSGLVSGSSQLTSSLDVRYALSGSVNTLKMTKLLNNVQAVTGANTPNAFVPDWTCYYTSSMGTTLMFEGSFTAYCTIGGNPVQTFYLNIDGVDVASTSFVFNNQNFHHTIPCIFDVEQLSPGGHTIKLKIPSGIVVDNSDYMSLVVIEAMAATGPVLSSIPSGTISGSSQLTSSYDGRYTLASTQQALNNTYATTGSNYFTGNQFASSYIESSLYLKAPYIRTDANGLGGNLFFGDVARFGDIGSGSVQISGVGINSGIGYLKFGNGTNNPILGANGSSVLQLTGSLSSSGSISAPTFIGSIAATNGVVSGSSQLTSSFDGRYLQTGSFNTYTGSINSFTASQQTLNATYATTGSNTFRGTETISGSLLVSGSTALTGSISISSGSITMPNRPAFRVTGNASTERAAGLTLSGSAISVDYNEGGYFNTTNGIFTAPIAGLYHIYYNGRVGGTNAAMQVIMYKNAGVALMWETAGNTGGTHFGVSGIVKLAVNDTIKVAVTVGSIQFDGNDNFGVAYIG